MKLKPIVAIVAAFICILMLSGCVGDVLSPVPWETAHLRISSRNTLPVVTPGVWINITFNHTGCAGLCKGFSHNDSDSTNDTITVNATGVYSISYVMMCEDTAINPVAHVGFRLINATDQTIIKGSYGEFDTSKKDMYVFKDHTFITTFNASDSFKVQFTASATTVTLTPHHEFNPVGPSCQINIHKISYL